MSTGALWIGDTQSNERGLRLACQMSNIPSELVVTQNSRRRPWLAVILSLLCPPVGHVYIGRLRRSLLLWLAWMAGSLAIFAGLAKLQLGKYAVVAGLVGLIILPVCIPMDAYFAARRYSNNDFKGYQRWWVYVVAAISFAFATRGIMHISKRFIAETFVIVSRSMAPTLLPGDRIVVDKSHYSVGHSLRRNDLAVFWSEGPGSSPYVMRVVGLPGDPVEISSERVMIDGKPWDDSHAVFDDELTAWPEIAFFGPLTVPPRHFFVLGDNRRRSRDSRFLGTIPISDLLGKARVVYWARDRHFPDREDTTHYVPGPIRWDRIGLRVDAN
jgi:signal peptidase I